MNYISLTARALLTAMLVVVAINNTWAQTPGPNARTAMGSPTGSYPIDNLESINYCNGRVHFELPLLNVEGRGTAQQAVMLTIDPVLPGVGKGCPNCPNFFTLSGAGWEYEVGYG